MHKHCQFILSTNQQQTDVRTKVIYFERSQGMLVFQMLPYISPWDLFNMLHNIFLY